MLPDANWLPETNERATVQAVARLAILRRLQRVSFYLPLATWFSHIHVESIHQLRVAIRHLEPWKWDSRFRHLVDTLETARQVETQCLDRKVKQFARGWTRDRIAE